ncbi:type 1 glutamine amidotransferase [Phosphitispora fastidiosa]|uniref:type 1 glutamine amidotransferase n=1 Tax=Phosphitispora fastidiosa TaxID=2837202 RepID=UPI001E5C5AFF|nr:gamma-glutamyl-gamma-aminobutyrate hydrolase family protein [Phosphitispora fastidiosa]MBU7005106.1 GMP synthase (glutamine-hydrolyzing) [Phosphitispora fastidiosa]
MLLVLNCLVEDESADEFDMAMSILLKNTNCVYQTYRASQTESIADLHRYSHLLISGSEASALDDNSWDELLVTTIDRFITDKKPVLGICYGHQFLARTIVGKECLKKRELPEIGWAKIYNCSNELFRSVNDAVSVVLHYDEVAYLTDDFRIIASSQSCPIHSYQYKDLPVWGIQFHPEYNLELSKEIFELFSKTEPKFDQSFINDLDKESDLENITKVIKNFINVKETGGSR